MEIEHHPAPRQSANPMWLAITAVIALFALTIAGVALMVHGSNESVSTATGTKATGAKKTVDVELGQFYVKPASIDVAAGTELVVHVTNKGTMPHDLKLDGTTGTDLIDPGKTATASLGVISQSTEAWCTVPGHKEAGMVMKINVTGASSEAATASQTPTSAASPAKAPTIQEISRHPSDMPDSADYTLYKDGKFFDKAPRNGPMNHEVHFQIKEGVAQVLPGTTMDYWTFDGAVPGPMIRTRVGDTVDFFLTNPKDSTMPHDVDFHAVTGPGGGSVRLDTMPGATSELKVKTLKPGIFIYHCAFPDVPTHISHGMYGLVVVEPPGGLPKVDHEYYVMQSEFYTTAGADKPVSQLENAGHLAFSAANGDLEEPTFVVFNGRPNAVTGDRALGVYDGDKIQTGQSVRLFVGNIGPNLISSFHIIGEIFDTVYVEGSFSLVNHDVQTTLVPSGGAVGVEFTPEVPGDYLMVDHAIFRALHKGANGIIHVEGAPNPEVYNSVTYSTDARGSGK